MSLLHWCYAEVNVNVFFKKEKKTLDRNTHNIRCYKKRGGGRSSKLYFQPLFYLF